MSEWHTFTCIIIIISTLLLQYCNYNKSYQQYYNIYTDILLLTGVGHKLTTIITEPVTRIMTLCYLLHGQASGTQELHL